MGKIFVVDVFRLMGVNPIKDDTWSVSRRIAEQYRAEVGDYPPSEYHAKTNGSGQHYMAAYPPVPWLERIKALIRELQAQEAAQADLFGREP